MSLGGVLVLTSSNKDKQAGITVVVHERRKETREKRKESWKRSLEESEFDCVAAAEEIFGGNLIVDVQITIVEVKNIYKFNLSFGFSLPFVSPCLQSQVTQFQDQELASRLPDFTTKG